MADCSLLITQLQKQGIAFTEKEPMDKHTTFHIGGEADLFIRVSDAERLAFVLQAAMAAEVPYTVIGNGSNLLVSDLGIEGAVLLLSGMDGIEYNGSCEITCGAGLRLSQLCVFAAEHDLQGLEFAWGIPGTVGGAVYMNAGAYDSEIGNVVTACTVLDTEGKEHRLTAEEMAFGYRTSLFQSEPYIITSVTVRLEPGDAAQIRAKMEDIFMRRKQKQPLEYPSAGSVFKRPQGNYAGTMIEACGLKGYTVGGAQVSEKHAGFIINIGNASASDVKQVIEHVQNEVFLKYSVRLEREVKYIGR
ncbi:MAG: UDP-N-acetylmuramate dehydrogenase [Clostridia bacterium]|nr:UDP-N-acetylmuramate dehydrogenase [Clostridia bacterium]